jgi:hypothetical protein
MVADRVVEFAHEMNNFVKKFKEYTEKLSLLVPESPELKPYAPKHMRGLAVSVLKIVEEWGVAEYVGDIDGLRSLARGGNEWKVPPNLLSYLFRREPKDFQEVLGGLSSELQGVQGDLEKITNLLYQKDSGEGTDMKKNVWMFPDTFSKKSVKIIDVATTNLGLLAQAASLSNKEKRSLGSLLKEMHEFWREVNTYKERSNKFENLKSRDGGEDKDEKGELYPKGLVEKSYSPSEAEDWHEQYFKIFEEPLLGKENNQIKTDFKMQRPAFIGSLCSQAPDMLPIRIDLSSEDFTKKFETFGEQLQENNQNIVRAIKEVCLNLTNFNKGLKTSLTKGLTTESLDNPYKSLFNLVENWNEMAGIKQEHGD